MSMDARFSITDWSAFAPGLEDADGWRAWAKRPWLPLGEAMAPLQAMAPMQRRRVDALGRAALQAAWDCQQDDDTLPQVFATRHGDIGRTHAMLTELAAGQPLSPTQFGLSTHNAIPAQYGIARGFGQNCVVVSAGAASAQAAVTEALGLIADGAPAVVVACFDGATPADFAPYRDEPEALYAWAWRMTPACDGMPVLSLRTGAPLPSALPHGLDVLRFFLAADASLPLADGGAWTRHA